MPATNNPKPHCVDCHHDCLGEDTGCIFNHDEYNDNHHKVSVKKTQHTNDKNRKHAKINDNKKKANKS